MPKFVKNDDRPACNSWAPGHYEHVCPTCKEHFVGDKRAVECADCAYSAAVPAADFASHIVVREEGEPRDDVLWVCEQCWPTTNEVLTLGRLLSLSKFCGICGYVSRNMDDLNPIWKSWIAKVLWRHWKDHTLDTKKPEERASGQVYPCTPRQFETACKDKTECEDPNHYNVMQQIHANQAAFDKRLKEEGKVRCGICHKDFNPQEIVSHLEICKGNKP